MCLDTKCVAQVLHQMVYLSAAKEALGSVRMDSMKVLCYVASAGMRYRDGAPAPGQVWWVPA